MKKRSSMKPFIKIIFIFTLSIASAFSQTYPIKPLRVIFPFAAGGAGDTIARVYGQKFAEKFSQSWILENHGGAGSTLGAAMVAKSPADGYTLLLGTLTFAVSAATYKKLPYDPLRDFTPIGPVGKAVSVLALTPSIKASTVKELIAMAQKSSPALTFASAGIGSTGHLSGELFMHMTGINLLHVPYQGTGAALGDLFSGRTHMVFEPLVSMLAHVRGGKMRAIGVTTSGRSLAAPDIPSLAEQGVEGYDVATWYGLMGPAGIPTDIVTTLNKALNEFIVNPEVKTLMSNIGVEPLVMNPSDFAKLIRKDISRWTDVAREAHVSF